MKSVLLRLYDGEICPAEQFGLKTEEYRSIAASSIPTL